MGGLVNTEFSPNFDPHNPVGKTFTQEFAGFSAFEGVITGYKPPESMNVTISNALVVLKLDYQLEENNDGTKLTLNVQWPPNDSETKETKNFLLDFTAMVVGKHLQSLKKISEQEAASKK
jgi:hypothetical protein